MTRFHRDTYLDARLPEWRAAERAGVVKYEPLAGVVEIFDAVIAARCADFQTNYATRTVA